jgi:flagellar biosynthesis component FlhA
LQKLYTTLFKKKISLNERKKRYENVCNSNNSTSTQSNIFWRQTSIAIQRIIRDKHSHDLDHLTLNEIDQQHENRQFNQRWQRSIKRWTTNSKNWKKKNNQNIKSRFNWIHHFNFWISSNHSHLFNHECINLMIEKFSNKSRWKFSNESRWKI